MYIVKDENTLGYTLGNVIENKPVRIEVMSVDVLKGGDPLLINRTTMADNWRPATKEDEDRFRCFLGL